MSMTREQLWSQLSAIEPEEGIYDGIGSDEIPLLEELLHDNESWVASRAVFALSTLSDAVAVALLSQASSDPRPEVRVALAASMRNLDAQVASNILAVLLDDPTLGVRKFAVHSVSRVHDPGVRHKLQTLETEDPEPAIRDLAKSKLRELQ